MCKNVKGNNISTPIISSVKISNNNVFALLNNGAKISTNDVEITPA